MELLQSQWTIVGSEGGRKTPAPLAMLCLARYMRLNLEQSRCNRGSEWSLAGCATEKMSSAVGLQEAAVDL